MGFVVFEVFFAVLGVGPRALKRSEMSDEHSSLSLSPGEHSSLAVSPATFSFFKIKLYT